MDMLQKIDRFGLEAITGRRQFYFGELYRLVLAENIVSAYKDRARSSNWAAWVNQNEKLANLLVEAETLAQE